LLTKRRRWTSCFNKEFWGWWLMEKCESLMMIHGEMLKT